MSERLEAMTHDGKPADFRGAIFPRAQRFSASFPNGVMFRGAAFRDRAVFDGVTVGSDKRPAEAAFEGATFHADVAFEDARVYGRASFNNAIFGSADDPERPTFSFSRVRFMGGASFSGARFHRRAQFDEAQFGVGARRTEIDVAIDEEEAERDDEGLTTWFVGTVFERGVSFVRARFFHEVRLQADFGTPGIEVTADFHRAQFHSHAIFDQAVFHSRADFTNARFAAGLPSFQKTQWAQLVTFEDAIFRTTFEARFVGARFGTTAAPVRVLFDRAEFTTFPVFDRTDFYGDVSFRDSVIRGGVCRRTQFFAGTLFHGRDTTKQNDETASGSEARPSSPSIRLDALSDVTFHQPKLVSLKRVDLQRCTLTNTDLRDVEFSEVVWPRIRRGFHRRLAIFDDPTVRQEQGDSEDSAYGEAERIYRQLRSNYEALQMYEEAGHFHYGELEMRRLRGGRFGRLVSLLNLYRLSSGYGNRYIRAGLVLLALIVLFGILMLRGSTQFQGPGRRYWPWPNSVVWWDVCRALLLALQAATFQRPSAVDRTFGQFVATVELIILPAQAALFLLALGRRFKR